MSHEVAPPGTVLVSLPQPLVSLFPGAPTRLELPAAKVADVLDALDARWPGMRDRLCDSTPAIRRNINVFVGDQRADLGTVLAPGAQVVIMTAISGGCGG